MPNRLPQGTNISVAKRTLPADYAMPTMDMAVDHYSVGFLISGDRRTITPKQSYDSHAGDVSMMPPFVYHKTVSLSDKPYQNYLIKFNETILKPLTDLMGSNFLDEMMEQKIHHFSQEDQKKIVDILEEMYQIFEKKAIYCELVLQGMLFRLFALIYENHTGGGAVYFKSQLSTSIVDALFQIEKNYADDISLEEISSNLGYSVAHFSRLFKKQLDMPFIEYLTNVRLKHVYDLLANSELSITEIAMMTGFCNGDYLSTRFKKKTGMTPSEFRKNVRKHASPSHETEDRRKEIP